MNSVPEPVLERDPPAVELARDEDDLLVLDVDAFHRTDSGREVEHLGLGERLRRVEAAVALPDQRRIQAFLDRRPDREGRSEVVVRRRPGWRRRGCRPRRARRTARRPRSARRRWRAPARRRSRRSRAGRLRSTARAPANWRSPSMTPGSLYGRSGCGSESVAAMSRYVQRASNAAAKICGLNRGSVAFRTASALASRRTAVSASTSDASMRAAVNRPSSSPSTTLVARSRSRSPTTIPSKKSRRWAIAAAAAPTPPAPTTTTFTCRSERRARQYPRRRTIADLRGARRTCRVLSARSWVVGSFAAAAGRKMAGAAAHSSSEQPDVRGPAPGGL